MKFEEIKELLEFIDKSSLSYLEIKESDFYIKLDKALSRSVNKQEEFIEEKINSVYKESKNLDDYKISEENYKNVEANIKK